MTVPQTSLRVRIPRASAKILRFQVADGAHPIGSGVYVDPAADSVVFANVAPATITRSRGSWLLNGFASGMRIKVRNTLSNDGIYTIATATALVLTLAAGDVLADETIAGAGLSIQTTGIDLSDVTAFKFRAKKSSADEDSDAILEVAGDIGDALNVLTEGIVVVRISDTDSDATPFDGVYDVRLARASAPNVLKFPSPPGEFVLEEVANQGA